MRPLERIEPARRGEGDRLGDGPAVQAVASCRRGRHDPADVVAAAKGLELAVGPQSNGPAGEQAAGQRRITGVAVAQSGGAAENGSVGQERY